MSGCRDGGTPGVVMSDVGTGADDTILGVHEWEEFFQQGVDKAARANAYLANMSFESFRRTVRPDMIWKLVAVRQVYTLTRLRAKRPAA
jgi:hypothetical protein